jgi:capsular polysaccharide biosynthesis protein
VDDKLTGRLAGPVPDADAATAVMLRDLDRALSSQRRPRVLIAVHGGVAEVAPEAVRTAYPEARVDVVDLAEPGWRRTTTGSGRLDLVIDGSGDPEARADLFDRTFPRLRHRRPYLAAGLRPAGTETPPLAEDELWARLVELLDARAARTEPAAATPVAPADLRRVVLAERHLLVERADGGPTQVPDGSGTGLGALVRLVGDVEAPVIGVFGGRWAAGVAERLGRRVPRARIHTLGGRMGPSRLHATLAAYGRFDLLVDATKGGGRSRILFRAGFLHLRPGGRLVLLNHPVAATGRTVVPDDDFWPYLVELTHQRGVGTVPLRGGQSADANWAAALRRIQIGPRHLVLTNGLSALAVLRDERTNSVAALRADTSIRLRARQDPMRFASRAVLGDGVDRDPVREPETFAVPGLSVREYHDVVCIPGQIAVLGNLVLPETYRHLRYARLVNRNLPRITRWFAEAVEVPATRLEGSYYYLDGELRHHFGHVTSEQLSRLWAWPAAKAADPDLRLLVSRGPKRQEPTEWELEFFEAAGVSRADVVSFSRPVVVERLVGVTPMFSMPSYVHPDIADTWNRIGDALERRSTMPPAGPRVFLTRQPGSNRWCHETPLVEQLFSDRGFTVVRPELLKLPDQIALVRRAEVVAGFAGSGMFHLMFAKTPKRVVLVRSAGYTPSNDYLIASVRGHTLDVVFCTPDVPAPRGAFTRAAFESSFHFDADTDGLVLARILDNLETGPTDPQD